MKASRVWSILSGPLCTTSTCTSRASSRWRDAVPSRLQLVGSGRGHVFANKTAVNADPRGEMQYPRDQVPYQMIEIDSKRPHTVSSGARWNLASWNQLRSCVVPVHAELSGSFVTSGPRDAREHAALIGGPGLMRPRCARPHIAALTARAGVHTVSRCRTQSPGGAERRGLEHARGGVYPSLG